MPAYRSSAEAEIRNAVVDRLRMMVPDARIIHEINVESFGGRIDVLAVGTSRIVAVEIKSEKDKLDRLEDQIGAMNRVAHVSVAALHEKFLCDKRPPDECRKASLTWIHPEMDRDGHIQTRRWMMDPLPWLRPKRRCLPADALGMLWVDELRSICAQFSLPAKSRMNSGDLRDLIRFHLTGEQITRAVCGAIRRRACVEADPIIEDAA